jgi:hypothetical protein
MGMGIALVLATTTLVWLEADAICVEAAAPVRTSATTKARMTVFISIPLRLYLPLKISLDNQMKQQ